MFSFYGPCVKCYIGVLIYVQVYANDHKYFSGIDIEAHCLTGQFYYVNSLLQFIYITSNQNRVISITILGKLSLRYRSNNSGDRTHPCLTPLLICVEVVTLFFLCSLVLVQVFKATDVFWVNIKFFKQQITSWCCILSYDFLYSKKHRHSFFF